jgi:hypothetical protein
MKSTELPVGTLVFGKAQHKRLVWFAERYESITAGILLPNMPKQYLGDKACQLCRYCGKRGPEVKFKKKAHAFPELIGNKSLIDHCECDTCNNHFSEKVEDDFSKFTMPWRTFGRVGGKQGIPSHKSSDRRLRIDAGNAELKVRVDRNDPRTTRDEARKTLTYRLERQPYRPMGVFKCLVKTALAVMPSSEAGHCAHLKEWILQPEHSFESFPYRPLTVMIQLIPGPGPGNQISYALLKRYNSAHCPYMVFLLQFSQCVFQITIPMPAKDLIEGEERNFDMMYYPTMWENKQYVAAYGGPYFDNPDFSGFDLVRDETVEVHMRYDSITQVNVTPETDIT